MRRVRDALLADPFGERQKAPYGRDLEILGARFEVTSNSRALMNLFDSAFGSLPGDRTFQRRAPTPVIRLALRLIQEPENSSARRREAPPPLQLESGAGFLIGRLRDAGSAVLAPHLAGGLVSVDRKLLRHPYHVRYELLEFAVYTLAARVVPLVPLHAACVGDGLRAVLMPGDSGAGKSTLAGHCLLEGLELLSEDSVFVEPETLRARSVPNFLHLQASAIRVLGPAGRKLSQSRTGTITRRSGVRKMEIDVRRRRLRIGSGPSPLAAVVFLSSARAESARLLVPLSRDVFQKRLERTQPYAAAQKEWPRFLRHMLTLPAYELRRGAELRNSSAQLCTLLRCASR